MFIIFSLCTFWHEICYHGVLQFTEMCTKYTLHTMWCPIFLLSIIITNGLCLPIVLCCHVVYMVIV
jgi:hypothetical protein